MAQVAANWVMCRGAVPLVRAADESQAWELAGAGGWRLDDNQAEIVGQRAKMTIASEARKGSE
eukprot:560514-Prorocentrum_minimum.AAC.1